jgi:hypothetical protein
MFSMTAAKPPSPHAHHLLQFMYNELKAQDRSLRWLANTAGVSYNTLKTAMRHETAISLDTIEAALNTLGYTTKPTMLHKETPKHAKTYSSTSISPRAQVSAHNPRRGNAAWNDEE